MNIDNFQTLAVRLKVGKMKKIITFLSILMNIQSIKNYSWEHNTYKDAILYRAAYHIDNETIYPPKPPDWIDFCNTFGYLCFGLYCNDNEFMDESFNCHRLINYIVFNNQFLFGFLHMINSSSSSMRSKSQKYFYDLKAQKSKKYFKIFTGKDLSKYDKYWSRYTCSPFTFESDTIPFIAYVPKLKTTVLVDYHCSLVYVRHYYVENFSGHTKLEYVDVKISIALLSLVILIYLLCPELNSNINGKCIMITTTLNIIWYSIYVSPYFLSTNVFLILMKNCLPVAIDAWMLILNYETFVLIRYLTNS